MLVEPEPGCGAGAAQTPCSGCSCARPGCPDTGRGAEEDDRHLLSALCHLHSSHGENEQPAGKITRHGEQRALAPAPAIVQREPLGLIDGHAAGASPALGSGWEGHFGRELRPSIGNQRVSALCSPLTGRGQPDACSDERKSFPHPSVLRAGRSGQRAPALGPLKS